MLEVPRDLAHRRTCGNARCFSCKVKGLKDVGHQTGSSRYPMYNKVGGTMSRVCYYFSLDLTIAAQDVPALTVRVLMTDVAFLRVSQRVGSDYCWAAHLSGNVQLRCKRSNNVLGAQRGGLSQGSASLHRT